MNEGAMFCSGDILETTSDWLTGGRLKGRKNNEARKVCWVNL